MKSSHDRPAPASTPRASRLMDQVRGRIRRFGLALRTEEAHCGWIRRFILYHGKRHPRDMGSAEMEAFLTELASRHGVAASTQNQALAALLFLYREVLSIDLPWMNDIQRATDSGANRAFKGRGCARARPDSFAALAGLRPARWFGVAPDGNAGCGLRSLI